MKPDFKKENVILSVAYCPNCEDVLVTLPDHEYQCGCGIWEPEWYIKKQEEEIE